MNTKTTIEAFREIYSGGIALMAWKYDGRKQFAGEITWKEMPAELAPGNPTMRFHPASISDMQALQRLADSLWEAGIRPSQTLGTSGEREAMAAHLQDFRALAAHALKVQLPNIPTKTT